MEAFISTQVSKLGPTNCFNARSTFTKKDPALALQACVYKTQSFHFPLEPLRSYSCLPTSSKALFATWTTYI